MTAEERLIQIYCLVCELFPLLAPEVERFSNNQEPSQCSEEEILTVYLFGLLQGRLSVKDIRLYIEEHWASWFPSLPKYEGYNHRLLRLVAALQHLLDYLLPRLPTTNIIESLQAIDSLPIIMARAGRADGAKVAREIADKGYCATKKLYYHGIKLHAVVAKGCGCLPLLRQCEFSAASEHDVCSLRRQLPMLESTRLVADKAYFYHHRQTEADEHGTSIYAIQPRVRRQIRLPLFTQVRNTVISRIRQPIESWFSWLDRKTHIQNASRVRSTKGLLTHLFGRLAAAMVAMIFNF